ncbi:L-lactate dehydrogenase [Bombilactobacillus bombi]|uniref:L-lactate dehydrogenase n=2 Tax=Bombilactobacillus bombi TaxID=1303590 RepID=A0A417ZF41_9LACO|nr:L-lactate dehydrogenase [Bombilactobacillus bombi]
MDILMNKVGIIGLGHVGATTALIMAQRGKVGKIVLVDKNFDKARAEQVDLQDQISLLDTDTEVVLQDYTAQNWEELKDLDVLVFCAGKIALLKEHGGQRDFELQMTSKIVAEVAPKIKASGFNGVIINITNPCDVIARLLQEQTGLPKQQVLGTGTGLETARMHHAVGEATGHNYHDVTGYVFGEHGDTMFPVWSTVRVAGKPISEWKLDLKQLTQQIVTGGYTIFSGKEYTNNGITTWVNLITEAVLSNAKRALPVTVYDSQLNLYIGQLAVIGENGVQKVVDLPLTSEEQKQYQASAQAILQNYQKVK